MPDTAPRRMTVAEFLAWDDGTDTRYELIDGIPVAMAPPADIHGRLAGRLIRHLGVAAPAGCEPVSEAGIVPDPTRADVLIADVAVTCAEPDPDRRTCEAVTVIVEVLSPSTRREDLYRKLTLYQQIPSVRDILMVDAGRRWVQHHRRVGEGWFTTSTIGAGTVTLTAFPAEIAMDDLYAGLPI